MFEKFFSSNSGDFRQRYQGTYGFFIDEKKNRFLCTIEEINTDNDKQYVLFRNYLGVPYTLYADVEGEIGFEFIPPRSAFHNTERGTYYVKRSAARQFQRGVSSNNTNIFYLSGGSFRQVGVKFDSLIPIYTKQITEKQAWERFQNKANSSVALSPCFAMIVATEREDYGSLYLYEQKIAEWTKVNDKYNIKLLKGYHTFLQEVMDAVNRLGMTNMEIVAHGKT